VNESGISENDRELPGGIVRSAIGKRELCLFVLMPKFSATPWLRPKSSHFPGLYQT
jgi:hypothetical protein